MPLGCDHFLLRDRRGIQEGLHRGFAEAPASLMRPVSIELFEPPVEIGLQLCDRSIKLFPKGDAVELVQHGLVEPLHDPIGLGAFGFRTGVIDVLDGEIKLVSPGLVSAVLAARNARHAA